MRQILTLLLLLTTFFCFATTARVTRIIDGDTFEIESGDKVRLIGINAPEISDIFGQEAKNYLSDLIEGKTVELQSDEISNDRDRYQRLLRYVILDGVDINKKMVLDGFAFAYLKFHFSKSTDYAQAQIQAKESNTGMWENSLNTTPVDSQRNSNSTLWQKISPKAYLIGSLVTALVFVGLFTYFKK